MKKKNIAVINLSLNVMRLKLTVYIRERQAEFKDIEISALKNITVLGVVS